MSILAQLGSASSQNIEALKQDVAQLPPETQAELIRAISNVPDALSTEQVAALMQAHIDLNQQSAAAEAGFARGALDLGAANAVDASVAIGASSDTVQLAAADFARMAEQAIMNGQPFSDLRYGDPSLTQQAQEAIYAQVAAQRGTTPEEIAAKAEAEKQATMQAIQGAVFGATTAASVNPFAGLLAGVELSPELVAMNANPPQHVASILPAQQRDRDQGFTVGQ